MKLASAVTSEVLHLLTVTLQTSCLRVLTKFSKWDEHPCDADANRFAVNPFASNRSIHVSSQLFFSSLRSVTSALHCISVVLVHSARCVPLISSCVAETRVSDLP